MTETARSQTYEGECYELCHDQWLSGTEIVPNEDHYEGDPWLTFSQAKEALLRDLASEIEACTRSIRHLESVSTYQEYQALHVQ